MSAPHGFQPAAPSAFAPTPAPASTPASTPATGERIVSGFASARERMRILAWLDEGLRPGRPGRLEREYPLLFGAGTRAVPVTLFEEGAPAAFCVLWPVPFRLARGPLRTGLISLVYTDPRQRGRGFARRVIDRAIQEARARGLGVCLLWSDLDAFYRDQGFTRAGAETLLAVDRATIAVALAEPASPSASDTIVEIGRGRAADWPGILALRSARECVAPLEDAASALAGLPDLDLRVARGPAGVVAFTMRGRGDDFAGVVHEWGGDPAGVLRCCQAHLDPDRGDDGLLLLAPRARSEVGWRLRAAGARAVTSPLAWFKIASVDALATDLAALVPGFPALRLLAQAAETGSEPRVVVEDPARAHSVVVAASALLGLVFGQVSEAARAEAVDALSAVVPEAVRDALPLPFFVSGLESI